MCGMPYIVTCSVLHTLKKLYLKNLGGDHLKKRRNYSDLFDTVLHTIWRDSHYMEKCKIHGILQTKHHTIPCNVLLWSFSANTEVYSELRTE